MNPGAEELLILAFTLCVMACPAPQQNNKQFNTEMIKEKLFLQCYCTSNTS